MPYTVNDVPPAAKNLTKPQKKKFAEIANAILEQEKKKGTSIKEAESKAISIALSQVKKEDEKYKNFVYSTVYETNLYKDENDRYFTICDSCKKEQYVDISDGYCEDCGDILGDSHGDLIDFETVENMSFSYMKNIDNKLNYLDNLIKKMIKKEEIDIIEYLLKSKHHIGLQHRIFEKDSGYLVSSHCVYETVNAFNKEYEKCIWKIGFIVNDDIFQKIKNGEYTGFSFGAKGQRLPLTNNIDEKE